MNEPIKYWKDGTKLIEKCLEKSAKADWADAPFPMDEIQATLWHEAQMNAYRHALEMMGWPQDGFDK